MSQIFRYGVIGLRMGRMHATAIEARENCALTAVYDPDPVAVDRVLNELHPGRVAGSWQEIITAEDINMVVIATPDQLHEEMTIAALEAGKHVLCEKPMALDLDACKNMIEASERTGNKLMIGQVCRYAPGFRKAKELVDSGAIGELYYVESEYAHDYLKVRGIGEWRLDPRRHGILGGGCHAIDLLSWIAGRPTEVFAYANHKMLKDWPTDDTTIAVLKYPNDVIGKVFCSISCKRPYTMRTLLYGSEGTILCDNKTPYVTVFHNGTDKEEIPVNLKDHNVGGEIDELNDAILAGREPATTGYDGASTVAICLGAVESSKTGMPVKISYLEEK